MRGLIWLASALLIVIGLVLLALLTFTPLQDDNVFTWTMMAAMALANLATGGMLLSGNRDAVPAGGILSMVGLVLSLLGILTRAVPWMFLLVGMNAVVASACFLIYYQGFPLIRRTR